jgi:hypothetical protein
MQLLVCLGLSERTPRNVCGDRNEEMPTRKAQLLPVCHLKK